MHEKTHTRDGELALIAVAEPVRNHIVGHVGEVERLVTLPASE